MGNPQHPYNYRKRSNKNVYDDYRVNETFAANAGKWGKVINVVSATFEFTGSNDGAGGFILTAATNGTASIAGGGTLDLSTLAVDTEYEFSVSSLTNDSATPVYVLFKK